MAQSYYIDPLPAPGRHPLPPDTAHHLARVLRLRSGDRVVLCDGRGNECEARLTRVAGPRVEAEIGPARHRPDPTAVRVELAFALPRGARAAWLFEHATEVGAAALRPVLTARSEPGAPRRERWLRVVRAAAGQCGRAHLPEVFEPETLEALLARPDLPAERYVAESGAPGLGAAHGAAALLLVGPPGGLCEEEAQRLRAAGFEARGLGPLTLRTETAALAGAVLLLAGR